MKHYARSQIIALRDATEYAKEISVSAISAQYGIPASGIIDLSLNINAFGPPVEAVCAADERLAALNRYPDVSQYELRSRLARWHGVTPDMVALGNGLDGVIKLIAQTFVDVGDHVIIPVPTFPRYALEVAIMGARVQRLRLTQDFQVPLRELLAHTTSETKMIFLCSPNNPTGVVIPRDTILELLRSGADQALVVVDEALAFPGATSVIDLVPTYSNLMVLRTFSKAYGLAGARVGYAVADPSLIEFLDVVRPPFNVNLVGEAAALGALKDPDFLIKAQKRIDTERDQMITSLSRLEGLRPLPSPTNLLFVEVSETGLTSTELAEALARHGVLVTDCRSYAGLEDEDTIRISLGRPADNRRFVQALEAVLAAAERTTGQGSHQQ